MVTWVAENGHVGHFGQSEVAENGPNGFPMPNNLGIYTKIGLVRCSEPKSQVWPLGKSGQWYPIQSKKLNAGFISVPLVK